MAQISNSLGQFLSAVEHLALAHDVHSWSSEEHDEVNRTEWRKLLRLFRNVTLQIDEELSRCLQLEDGELLPELQELTYAVIGDIGDAFASFVDARQNTDHPITITQVRPSPSPSPKPSSSVYRSHR